MQFHPYAKTYPMLEGLQWEEFLADVAARGIQQSIRYRMVDGERQGLDGRNRLKACGVHGIECPAECVEVADEDVEAFIDSLNSHRRHLTPAQQAERRKGRVERIAAARAEGKSTRAIAEEEGVSQTQVLRDEKKSGEPYGSPEKLEIANVAVKTGDIKDSRNGITVGKDGKTYPAAKTILCEKCKRLGATTGCPQCQALRDAPSKAKAEKDEAKAKKAKEKADKQAAREAAKEKVKADREAAKAQKIKDKEEKAEQKRLADEAKEKADSLAKLEEEQGMADAEGLAVPPRAIAAFQTAKTIETICREIDGIIHRIEAIAKGPGGRMIRYDSIKQQLKDAKGNLWANRATHVCPYCHGKKEKCDGCNGEGWTARYVYDQAPGSRERKHQKAGAT